MESLKQKKTMLSRYLLRNASVFVVGCIVIAAMVFLTLKVRAMIRAEAQISASRYENLKEALIGQTAAIRQLELLPKNGAQISGGQSDGQGAGTTVSGACTSVIYTLPATLTRPGVYCLGMSFDQSSSELDAINIESDNVVIDGQGYSITGPASLTTRSRGIIAIDRSGITIRDLRLEGFFTAVHMGDSTTQLEGSTTFPSNRKSRDILIERVRTDNSAFHGIYVSGDNVTIRDNTIAGVGPSSVNPHSFATGIGLRGNNCRIRDNRVSLGDATGSGENIGIAVNIGSGCLIDDNVVYFDKYPEWSRNFGIWTKAEGGSLPVIRGNLVAGSHFAYGPHGIFEGNASESAACSLFAKRDSGVDALVDNGGNIDVHANGFARPGRMTCVRNASEAEDRFWKSPSDLSAYSVALTIAETDPVVREADTLAWLMVAAELGHTIAKDVAANPAIGGYKEATIQSARSTADNILSRMKLAKPE